MKWRSAAAALTAALALWGCDPDLPKPQIVSDLHYLQPDWAEHREGFYARQQGTVMFPADWFLALEKPGKDELLWDLEYLNQFGFITDGVTNSYQGRKLPVGLTVFDLDMDGIKGKMLSVGCAACHTGQINYKGKGLRVDGGGAHVNLDAFQKTIAATVIATYLEDEKFDRFAKRVLKENYSKESRAQLKTVFEAQAYKPALQAIEEAVVKKLYPSNEGFGRLDALQRIANTLLANDLAEPSNNQPADAPVHFPPLWDITKFDWVQYNGSVRQPMIRNVGESLGVAAQTSFTQKPDDKPTPYTNIWNSSVPVKDLHASEQDIAALPRPRWPEPILGKIDQAKAAQGRALFDKHCASCHARRETTRVSDGKSYPVWQLPVINADEIGTDDTLVWNFIKRTYDASKIDPKNPALKSINAGFGLWVVTQNIKEHRYLVNDGIAPSEWPKYDGLGWANEVRAPCGFKARPLDSIWSTPPFLHNGSVPTVYDLLSPLDQRPKVFYVGNLEYDPDKLGYESGTFPGGTRFDTTTKGNANIGHEFTNTPGKGVIGPMLSHDEKMQLIEYLKVMADDAKPITRPVQDEWQYPCHENGMSWRLPEDYWKKYEKQPNT